MFKLICIVDSVRLACSRLIHLVFFFPTWRYRSMITTPETRTSNSGDNPRSRADWHERGPEAFRDRNTLTMQTNGVAKSVPTSIHNNGQSPRHLSTLAILGEIHTNTALKSNIYGHISCIWVNSYLFSYFFLHFLAQCYVVAEPHIIYVQFWFLGPVRACAIFCQRKDLFHESSKHGQNNNNNIINQNQLKGSFLLWLI